MLDLQQPAAIDVTCQLSREKQLRVFLYSRGEDLRREALNNSILHLKGKIIYFVDELTHLI